MTLLSVCVCGDKETNNQNVNKSIDDSVMALVVERNVRQNSCFRVDVGFRIALTQTHYTHPRKDIRKI